MATTPDVSPEGDISEKAVDAHSTLEVVRSAHESRVFTLLARSGWAATGLLHLLIGGLAIALAIGERGVRADEVGAFQALAAPPIGGVLLVVVTASLVGLGLWMIADAALNRGPRQRLTSAIASAAQGVVYLALAALPMVILFGGSFPRGGVVRRIATFLLETPGGAFVLVMLGAGVMVSGVYFVLKGVMRRFSWELRPLPPRRGRAVRAAGMIGYVARGVAFVLLGLLIVVEALESDANGITGLDGTFTAVRGVFLGPVMLGLIGAGLAVYGVYGFARARLSGI